MIVSQINYLTKLILVAAVCWGLIGISSLSVASAATSQVITGDTQKYRIFEGFAPTMQPWEAGMVTNPMPGTFEWWYFQGQFTDGSKTQTTLFTKPDLDNNGPLQPYLNIGITTPNGTQLGGLWNVDTSQFKAARNTLNVTMGKNWAHGDLNTTTLHIAPTQNYHLAASSSRELKWSLIFRAFHKSRTVAFGYAL